MMVLETAGGVARHPSSYPFLLVDKLLGMVGGERAVGLRNVTANDPLLAGGDRRPLTMRRALIIEAFAQLAAMVLGPDAKRPAAVEVKRVESMQFTRSPVPGDQIVLNIELSRRDEQIKASCRAEAGGQTIADGAIEIEVLPDE